MSLSYSVTDLLADYIAMITEDIQTEVIANNNKCITLYPYKKMIFFKSQKLPQMPRTSNNGQCAEDSKTLGATRVNAINHGADMLGFKTLRYNYLKLYKFTNCT